MKSYSLLLPPEMQHAGKHLRIQKKQKKKKKVENNNALSHARLVVHHHLVVVVRRLRHLSGDAVRFIIREREREREK